MSRTSTSQFEVMVDFMERNGDLNKPMDGPQGRLNNLKKWEELTAALNLDTAGTAKPIDKWKKVWSDFKNNTKRKAAKINRAAGGTGGGPACKLMLSDLKERVLNLIGTQAATGLVNINEVGIELPPEQPGELVGSIAAPPAMLESPTPSTSFPVEHGVHIESGLSGSGAVISMVEPMATSPTTEHARTPRQRRNRRRRSRSTPRRARAPPAPGMRVDAARQQFAASDAEWRNLMAEVVRGHQRQRDLELEHQAQWLQIARDAVALISQFLNRF